MAQFALECSSTKIKVYTPENGIIINEDASFIAQPNTPPFWPLFESKVIDAVAFQKLWQNISHKARMESKIIKHHLLITIPNHLTDTQLNTMQNIMNKHDHFQIATIPNAIAAIAGSQIATPHKNYITCHIQSDYTEISHVSQKKIIKTSILTEDQQDNDNYQQIIDSYQEKIHTNEPIPVLIYGEKDIEQTVAHLQNNGYAAQSTPDPSCTVIKGAGKLLL